MRKVYSLHKGVQKFRTKKDNFAATAGLAISGLLAAIALPFAVHAQANTVVVTPTNTQGWGNYDTRPGGTTSYVADPTTPYGKGALQLATDTTNAAKADYMKSANNLPLGQVTNLSYWTKQVAASSPGGDASYQLVIDTNGAAPDVPGVAGYTTLVYEPYWQNAGNPDPAPVVGGQWQQWDVANGQFWSSRTVGGMTAGAGGPPLYTLAQVEQMNPDATVLAYGVNVGSYNPSYNINVDGVQFNDTTYDFEQYAPVTDKDACKDGGWKTAVDANGNGFKNQGQCVSYVASGGKSQH